MSRQSQMNRIIHSPYACQSCDKILVYSTLSEYMSNLRGKQDGERVRNRQGDPLLNLQSNLEIVYTFQNQQRNLPSSKGIYPIRANTRLTLFFYIYVVLKPTPPPTWLNYIWHKRQREVMFLQDIDSAYIKPPYLRFRFVRQRAIVQSTQQL